VYKGVVSLASVQLEEGDTANEFAYEDHYKTLEKCQRFYEVGTSSVTTVTDGSNPTLGVFKVVQLKRTKRNKPDIFVTLDENTGHIDTIGVGHIDERKFVVNVGVTGSEPGLRRAKFKWIADSEIPLYNNVDLDEQGNPGRTTKICAEETACHLALKCKLIAEDDPSCGTVPGFQPRAEGGIASDTFKMFFSDIPSKDMDAEFESELGDSHGGLIYYYYEGSAESWPYAHGEPYPGQQVTGGSLGGSDPRNLYWCLITGPRFDALGRPCDPHGPTASDGTGGIWSPSQRWGCYDEATCNQTNRSFRGRAGWSLRSIQTDHQDARPFADYKIVNLNFAFDNATNRDVFFPSYFKKSDSNYTDWQQRGCAGPNNCPGAKPIDPLIEASKDYIYHQLSGTMGENIVATFRTMTQNMIDLVRYTKTAPVADLPLAGKQVGFYAFPFIDLWGQPINRVNGDPVPIGYHQLTPDQMNQLKEYSYNRMAPIYNELDYMSPSMYNLYSHRIVGSVTGHDTEQLGIVGSINNNDPDGPYYSPYFKQTPWPGAWQVQKNWETNNRDKIDLSKRVLETNPTSLILPAVSPLFWSAGQTIWLGAEYRGWQYTTMCNPDCIGVSGSAPSEVVGNCYEDWRCWDKVLPIEDWITTQIAPVIDGGGHGVQIWWAPIYSSEICAGSTREQGYWWSTFTDTNPNITQFNINDFPDEITGPDGSRLKRDSVDSDLRVARWYSIIDAHPIEMYEEIKRRYDTNPSAWNSTINGWFNTYGLVPEGAVSTSLVKPNPTNGERRILNTWQQNYFNWRHELRKMFVTYFLDGADPANPEDSRLGQMAGDQLNQGWYAPALHRLLKIIWSKYLLHYSIAAKQYAENRTYAAEWNVVTAFGGQAAFNSILNEINNDPVGGIDPSQLL